MKPAAKEFFKVFGLVLVTAFVIRTWVIQPFRIEGPSMEPNFHSGELLLVDKISYALRGPKRGEVVVFKNPTSTSQDYIKRIIGLPGETIRIEKGQVFVNDQLLNEPYLPDGLLTSATGSDYNTTLTKDQYFVMGDNRERSFDSRSWGPLEKKYLIGRSTLVLYPSYAAGAN